MIRQRVSVLIAIVLLMLQTAIAIDFAQLKDTYSILSDEYKHCSPIYGAVWVETGILKKYYQYYAKDDLGNSKYFTVKLLQTTFIVIGESLSVTRSITRPQHYFSSSIIGSIIGAIENSVAQDKKALAATIEKLISQDAQFLLETTSLSGADLKIMNRQIKGLANAIVGSLDECGFWTGDSSLYPRYMTHAILLACLYKISNEKVDLKEYFNTLSATIGKDIFTSVGKNIIDQASWNISKFDKNILDSIIAMCAQQANIAPSQDTLSQLLQIVSKNYPGIDPFEALVCAEINKQFYSTSLPLVIGQNKNQPTFEGRPYSDCAEVALRNLCNFVVFNQEKLIFIPVKTENIAPSQKLIQYYQGDQADAKKHTRPDMYQAWASLLQNIPGFIYTVTEFDRRLLGNDLFNQSRAHPCYVLLNPADIQALRLPKATSGDFYNLNINGEDYRVVDATKHKAYAVWQSLKNIIILLNYLFGLKLYDDPLAPFKDTKFCSKYFPLLCKKLGWSFKAPQYQVVYPNPPLSQAFNPFTLDTPYVYWCHTIQMSLTRDPRISWDCHIKWHHIEIRNPQNPAVSPTSNAYKQKLYDGLLACDDSMQVYALMALYASKTDEQKNKAQANVLSNDTIKNRFALYLQDVGTISPEALTIAQGGIEVPKAIKTKGKKAGDNLQARLKQLKGKLRQLQNRLLVLKKAIGDLKKALTN